MGDAFRPRALRLERRPERFKAVGASAPEAAAASKAAAPARASGERAVRAWWPVCRAVRQQSKLGFGRAVLAHHERQPIAAMLL